MVIAQPSPHVSSISFVYVEFSIWSEMSFVSVFCCYFVYDIAYLLLNADIYKKLKKKDHQLGLRTEDNLNMSALK